MKAIIELNSWKTSQARALRAAIKADAGKPAPAGYHLDFDSMACLFSDISPARMQVIEPPNSLVHSGFMPWPRRWGGITRICIATSANYWSLLARDENGKVYVPWKDEVLNVSLTGDTLAA